MKTVEQRPPERHTAELVLAQQGVAEVLRIAGNLRLETVCRRCHLVWCVQQF